MKYLEEKVIGKAHLSEKERTVKQKQNDLKAVVSESKALKKYF